MLRLTLFVSAFLLFWCRHGEILHGSETVAARHISDLGILPIKGTWQRAAPDSSIRLCTADYSNVLSLLRWND